MDGSPVLKSEASQLQWMQAMTRRVLLHKVVVVPFHTVEDCAASAVRHVKRQDLLNIAVPCLFAQNHSCS